MSHWINIEIKLAVSKQRIAKHSDIAPDGADFDNPEQGAEFEIFLKSSGSYENSKESERDILVTDKDGFAIKTYDGEIIIEELKIEGKKKMNVIDFLNGVNKDNLLGKMCTKE